MDSIADIGSLIPDFLQPTRLEGSGNGRSSGSIALSEPPAVAPQLDHAPSEKRLAAINRRLELEAQLGESEAVVRSRKSTETRRFPGFDEETQIEETLLEKGAGTTLLDIRVTREQIPLDPQTAAVAQANLDPERVKALLLGS